MLHHSNTVLYFFTAKDLLHLPRADSNTVLLFLLAKDLLYLPRANSNMVSLHDMHSM